MIFSSTRFAVTSRWNLTSNQVTRRRVSARSIGAQIPRNLLLHPLLRQGQFEWQLHYKGEGKRDGGLPDIWGANNKRGVGHASPRQPVQQKACSPLVPDDAHWLLLRLPVPR